MNYNLSCFKAYDIRGKVGSELSNELSYKFGVALVNHLQAKSIVVGHDVRLSSLELKEHLMQGIRDAGADVIDIDLTGTEEVYFATSFLETDGGVQITASHNPKEYNGLKVVGKGSIPIGFQEGLKDIRDCIANNELKLAQVKGKYVVKNPHEEYIDKLMSFINVQNFKRPLKLLINIGNGVAGRTIASIQKRIAALKLPLEIITLYEQADGNFPNGVPNPILENCRQDTIDAVIKHKADLGIAFDGDFDRCFFFDENGNFVDGYYVVGLLAKCFLEKEKGAYIVYEPRLIWNTESIIAENQGQGIKTPAGHSFIKNALREKNAIYGGEMSAHHYFRDFFYCDSGMITWLVVAELLQKLEQPLSKLVDQMILNFPISGEMSFTIRDYNKAFADLKEFYKEQNPIFFEIDGLCVNFPDWRFNVRASNTEPYIRVNIESRGDIALIKAKQEEISNIIKMSQ